MTPPLPSAGRWAAQAAAWHVALLLTRGPEPRIQALQDRLEAGLDAGHPPPELVALARKILARAGA